MAYHHKVADAMTGLRPQKIQGKKKIGTKMPSSYAATARLLPSGDEDREFEVYGIVEDAAASREKA